MDGAKDALEDFLHEFQRRLIGECGVERQNHSLLNAVRLEQARFFLVIRQHWGLRCPLKEPAQMEGEVKAQG